MTLICATTGACLWQPSGAEAVAHRLMVELHFSARGRVWLVHCATRHQWCRSDVRCAVRGRDMCCGSASRRALLVRRGKRYRDYESYTKEQRAAEERRIHERFKSNQEEQNKLQTNVRAVLEHVFESSEEIPLQAMYR